MLSNTSGIWRCLDSRVRVLQIWTFICLNLHFYLFPHLEGKSWHNCTDAFSAASKSRPDIPFPSLSFRPAGICCPSESLSQATESHVQHKWISVSVWTKLRHHYLYGFSQVACSSCQTILVHGTLQEEMDWHVQLLSFLAYDSASQMVA